VPEPLALLHHARPALFQLAGDPCGVAFHREVQVADGHPGDQVAHRASGKVNVALLRPGDFLHALERPALLGREPAFQQEHVVRHRSPLAAAP